jgi:hypothetical protein
MDRGYDSEKMHRFIRGSLKAISIIPTRSWKGTEHVWGKYRKEMTDNFDTVRYRKRFLVEPKFSILKRRFGADLKSRIFQIQKKKSHARSFWLTSTGSFNLSVLRVPTEPFLEPFF